MSPVVLSSVKVLMISFVIYYFCTTLCNSEKITYISTEHPSVTYINPKYMSYGNVTSRRVGRHDPFYYVTIHFTALCGFGNNITIDYYFLEFLTNRYKRSFVEMHFKLCDLIHKDMFFGSAMKQGMLDRPCPYPAGDYHLYNMTIPVASIPPHFPFNKGRILMNTTVTNTKEVISSGYIDMEIKQAHIKKNNISTKS